MCDAHEHEVMRRGIKLLLARELVKRSVTHTHTHTQTCATQRLTLQGGQTRGEPRERQCVSPCVRSVHEGEGQNNKRIRLESGTEKQTNGDITRQTDNVSTLKIDIIEKG